jgi:hypothetical protein
VTVTWGIPNASSCTSASRARRVVTAMVRSVATVAAGEHVVRPARVTAMTSWSA